jgi:hypothetical protein
MDHRRIARAFGALASGLLSVAFLPDAIALADDLSSANIDPVAPETLTGLYNMITAPPGVNESLQGYGEFNVLSSTGSPEGSFYAYESTAPYLTPNLENADYTGFASRVLYVDSNIQSLLGAQAPDASYLPDGSVVSTSYFGTGAETLYTAIPGTGTDPDTVTYTLITPYGSIDLSSLVNGLGFDAAHLVPALPNLTGDTITALSDPTIVAVNGLPPADIAVQGIQAFEYNGNPDATFNSVETTTEDILGTHTEAILVTQDTGTADAPPVGTIYNVIDFHDLENVYSSAPTADGPDKITDILYDSATGQSLDLSSLFSPEADESAGLVDGSSIRDISFGSDIIKADPGSQEVFTGVNGLPPLNASVQGTQLFDLYQGGSDDPSATFNADVTTMPDNLYFHYSESLLVTESSDPSSLPLGSVFDVTTYGSGYESVYSDLPGLGTGGHDLITDTLVTPYGDVDVSWLYTMLDASAGLNPSEGLVSLLDGAWIDLIQLF